MTESEFNEAFGKKAMLVRCLTGYHPDGSCYIAMDDDATAKKISRLFDHVIRLDNGWYWARLKTNRGWTPWEILYIDADGGYESGDTPWSLKGGRFVLIPANPPELSNAVFE